MPKPSVPAPAPAAGQKPEHKILFQKFFRSVGPRTYAAQIKEASNGNHYLVLTEGKREEGSDEVKKTRLFVYSEDFGLFFRMLHETAQWIRANPVPDEVKKKRQRYWEKHGAKDDSAAGMEPPVPPARQSANANRNGAGASKAGRRPATRSSRSR
jgi:hypothetical protein